MREIPEVKGNLVGVKLQPVKHCLFPLRAQMFAWVSMELHSVSSAVHQARNELERFI
jgi:hypothetical protein